MTQSRDLSDILFNAFEAGEALSARECLSEDFALIQNGGPPMDRETLLKFATAFRSAVAGYRYEDVEFSETNTGFVREHVVRGTLPDGSELHLPACVVADIADGEIVSVREYLDTAKAVAVAKALAAR